jgi:hypothetical protein
MENWWLQYAISKEGRYLFNATFKQAMQAAFDMCISPSTVVQVYNGRNQHVASQTLQGGFYDKSKNPV